MAVKKIGLEALPEEKKKELQGLIGKVEKEYIVIGSGVYEIEPLPAIKLLSVLTQINEILMETRTYKQKTYQPIIEELYNRKAKLEKELENANSEEEGKEIEQRLIKIKADINTYENLMDNIRLDDVFAIPSNRDKALAILKDILEGVDEDDFNSMTVEQLMDTVVKIVKLNFGKAGETAEAIKQVADEVNKEDAQNNPLQAQTTR